MRGRGGECPGIKGKVEKPRTAINGPVPRESALSIVRIMSIDMITAPEGDPASQVLFLFLGVVGTHDVLEVELGVVTVSAANARV